MKKIIKTAWSCWDKLDQFVVIFSSIAIIVIMCLMCTSCNAQPSINNIPDMEYNDASGEELDYDGAILFFADGIIDFIYHTQDNEYVIEYDDPDAFDSDNMKYNKDDNYYYIEIYCDSALFFEYLSYYSTITNKDPEFFDASEKYFIEEDYLSDGTSYYKLVKYAIKEDI